MLVASLLMQFSSVWNMSLWFFWVLSLFSHCIITDDQFQTASTGGRVIMNIIQSTSGVLIHCLFIQRWSSLYEALYWFMLGWLLCNFAQGLACVNSTVNIRIWTTAPCSSTQLETLVMPQGFPAMRKAITITVQSESSFVQTCMSFFCGCVQALQ